MRCTTTRGPRARRAAGEDFLLLGTLGTEPVEARLSRGHLVCSPALRRAAMEQVERHEVFVYAFRPPIRATLSGPAIDVMVTLMRACTSVTRAHLESIEITVLR